MSEQEILEGNKLISEFMNLESWNDNRYGLLFNSPIDGKTSFSLNYDTSHDWLMTVVEKIEELKYPDIWKYTSIELRRHRYINVFYSLDGIIDYGDGKKTISNIVVNNVGGKDVEVLFKTIVEFVKKYNLWKQKK